MTTREVASALRDRYRRVRDRDRELDELRNRVRALEDEIQEQRQLNRRVAELTDVVTELLLPLADRDPERVAALLDEYRARI